MSKCADCEEWRATAACSTCERPHHAECLAETRCDDCANAIAAVSLVARSAGSAGATRLFTVMLEAAEEALK